MKMIGVGQASAWTYRSIAGIMAIACIALAFSIAASTAAAAQPLIWGGLEEVKLPTSLDSTAYSNLQVACSTAGSCVAAGRYYYDPTDETFHAIVASEIDGTWEQAEELPLPANALKPSYAYFEAASCSPSGPCVAVGVYENEDDEYLPMAVTETNGTWGKIEELELPAHADAAATYDKTELASVSCPAAGSCTAVGWYDNASSDEVAAMAVTQSGGVWERAKEVSQPANAFPYGWLESVSCTASGSCAATGWYYDASDDEYEAMAANEVSGSWEQTESIKLPSSPSTYVEYIPYEAPYYNRYDYARLEVSCVAAGSCAAGGYYEDQSDEYQPVALSETSGTWEPAETVKLPGNAAEPHDAYFESVSCPQAGPCVAVGAYENEDDEELPMVASATNGTWGQAEALELPEDAPSSEQNAGFYSVSCSTSGTCTAGGYYKDEAGDYYKPMVVSETSGTWEKSEALELPEDAPSSKQEAYLTSISCAPAGPCAAAGWYMPGPDEYELMAVNGVPSLAVSTSSLPGGNVGVPYETDLSAVGGAESYTWTLAPGSSLPAGLTLSSGTGVISGTPTAEGNSTFTVQVGDPGPPAQTASTTLSISIGPAPMTQTQTQTQTTTTSTTKTTTTTTSTAVATPKPLISIESSKLKTTKGKVEVKLACKDAACKGTIELVDTVKSKVKRKGKTHVKRTKLTLGKGSYSLAAGKSGSVTLALSAKGKALLAKLGKHKQLSAKLSVTVTGGAAVSKTVKLS